jgi:hypothetical protein
LDAHSVPYVITDFSTSDYTNTWDGVGYLSKGLDEKWTDLITTALFTNKGGTITEQRTPGMTVGKNNDLHIIWQNSDLSLNYHDVQLPK